MPQQLEEKHEITPHVAPPRNRCQRREEEARNYAGTSYQQPRQEAEEYDSDEQQRSCDLDDDDENLPFSRELRSAQVPNHYVMPKIPKYDGRGDPEKHLNAYKTHMSLRDATRATKTPQGSRRGRGRGRGSGPRNRSNQNPPGYCVHHRSYGHDTVDYRDYAHRSWLESPRDRNKSSQANRHPPKHDNRRGHEEAVPRQRDVSQRQREREMERPKGRTQAPKKPTSPG
ncbi:uncharacterized protein LOC111412550 [Olea europaea var. sylvestris]|uniref:uncharacterized protein LOC111412550 n=1 Tax=Olea europaea var. sylvestris TaxID=158386 RepID=UPI000C1D113A|nr:uncharacterized protein LOC111412550 [Olea europaea var. sylvestris]